MSPANQRTLEVAAAKRGPIGGGGDRKRELALLLRETRCRNLTVE